MYQLTHLYENEQIPRILRTTDGAMIPADPGNRDYQAYQEWLDQGNTPLPADQSAP